MNDIRSVIDLGRILGLQMFVFLTCVLMNMLDGMDVLVIAYAAPALAGAWSIAPGTLGSIAARLYPSEIRNTGIGWGIGAGRTGAIVGPKVSGTLVGLGLSMTASFIFFCRALADQCCRNIIG